MIFVKPAKFLAPLGPRGPAAGLRGGLSEGRGAAAAVATVRGESVFKFTATVEMEAAGVAIRSPDVQLAGSHQELANSQMDRTGPLGKNSSINTPRVQFRGVCVQACVCVCVRERVVSMCIFAALSTRSTANLVQPGL